MGLFKYWPRSIYMIMQLLMMKLVISLVWLFGITLAQIESSEAVTGAVNLTNVGIACLGNLALFITSLVRGRLYLEMGARDVMAILTGPKLKDIDGFGLRTREDFRQTSVIMLSMDTSNSSLQQFMKYIDNAHDVPSVMLQCVPLKDALRSASVQIPLESAADIAEIYQCSISGCNCNCVVFWTVKEISTILARRLPAILKQLSDSLCLLPSLQCKRNGCHGCNQNLLNVGGYSNVEFPAVCEVLDFEFKPSIQENPICICIPVHPPSTDNWTKLLMRSFKSKDQEDRGAIVMASDALENYLDGSTGGRIEEVFYRTTSLIVPRLAEISINLVLTSWFKVDGFSSALLARKAISHYIMDSKGNGFYANVFLTSAVVKFHADNTSVCQVLRFRGGTLLSLRTLSFIVGGINLICSFTWAVLVALEKSVGKWYKIQSMPPSKPRLLVMMMVICIGLGMDCLEMFSKKVRGKKKLMHMVVIGLEIGCIATGSVIAGALGINRFGIWVYSALQGLVWVKWGIGCYMLGEYSPEYVHIPSMTTRLRSGHEAITYSSARWIDNGILVYSSSFLFNAVLSAVRGVWE